MQNIDITSIAKKYLKEINQAVNKIKLEDIQQIATVLLEAYNNGNTVFIMGNGGSASTASHMACDLGKGTLKNVYNDNEKRLRIISITDNVATLTAFANDLSYDDIFSQQLHNLIKSKDVLIGISGYGNSPNIVKALEYAKSQDAITIGLLGNNGGKAKQFSDFSIIIDSNSYGVIEDMHLILNHLLATCLNYTKEQIDNENSK